MINVNAETLPADKNGKITLDKNYTIESTVFDSNSDVTVLDLNGKTLTLNGTLKLKKDFEVKNGTIVRNSTYNNGTLIETVGGKNTSVSFKNVAINGNKVTVSSGVKKGPGYALFVGENSSAVLDGVKLFDHYTENNIVVSGIYAEGSKNLIIKNSEIYGNKTLNASYDSNIGSASSLLVNYGEYIEIANTKIHDNYNASFSTINLIDVKKILYDKDSVLKNNETGGASGMRLQDSAGIIAGTFEGNKSTRDNGGGLYVLFKKDENLVVNITSTAKFINNETSFAGGGLYVNGNKNDIPPGRVIIEGATFTGNKALGTVDSSAGLYKDVGGGAIAVARGILEINDIKTSGNTTAINKGNSVIVSHANGNINGGKLTINGGTFDESIDLGAGSIVVNGGTFKDDMSKYISDSNLVSLKTANGYKVVKKDGKVSLTGIAGNTDNDEVILNAINSIDLNFNELNQKVTYKVKIKNDSDNLLYVNDLVTEGLSDDFIDFSLGEKSFGTKIEPGKTKEIEIIAKTLNITNAGRNVNDEVTLKILLEETKIINPETGRNLIIYLILVVMLFIALSTVSSKIDKKKRLAVIMIVLLCGAIAVSANESNYIEIKGKVKFISQNLLQESGTVLEGTEANYITSTDVWKHASEVKNIIISDTKTKPEEYDYRYDLTFDGSKKIYGYLVENGDNKTPYDLYIVANGVIYAPNNATGLFSFPNVETIKGLEYIEFDNTTNMTGMFLGNKKLKSVNVKSINTSNVKNTSYMFNGCEKLNVSEKEFNLEKVTNKKYMFNEKLSDVVKLNTVSDKDTDFEVAPVTGKYMIESTKNDKNPIYYYRGAVKNNNVLFANKCWKMVRTTETGGVKLIYNGVPSNDYTKYESAGYINVVNDSSKPFSFDTTTQKWTSTNKTHNSNSVVTFNVSVTGDYFVHYEISSESSFDWAWFYKNGTLVGKVSGLKTGTINLGNLTVSDELQVKYSKDVSVNRGDDNVVFYIARGTEVNPTCNNTGAASQIGISAFNSVITSPAHVGYMYGEVYNTTAKSLKNQTATYLYSNDVSWDGTKYTLTGDTLSSSSWKNDYTTLATKYHYTCFNDTGICENVYYISYFGSADSARYLTLKNGKNIEKAKEEMFANKTDSTIKTAIDNWYKENMTIYTERLEDTVWCNDRTLIDGPLFSKDASASLSLFGAHGRNVSTLKPSVTCTNIRDSFTVSDANGNGKLTYPVGLLTSDEYTLAGSGNKGNSTTAYLRTGQNQWTLSPYNFSDKASRVFRLHSSVVNSGINANAEIGVRPSVSLKPGTYVYAGDGTANNPYIVE